MPRNSTAGVENLDLNLDEFAAKVNADLVGNVVNLASRTAKFAERLGLAAEYPDDGGLFAQATADGDLIAEAYESGEYHRAMRLILAAGDRANQFIDRVAPVTLPRTRKRRRISRRLARSASTCSGSWPCTWPPSCQGWPGRRANC